MGANKYIKGFLEDIVLQLIHENGKMYGYEISQKVKEITAGDLTFTEGALYPVLHRLEGKGMLAVSFENVEGRTRKYYALTPEGGRSIPAVQEGLFQFLSGLQRVFNLKSTTHEA